MTENSAEYNQLNDTPEQPLETHQLHGRVRIAHFTKTQVAEGAADVVDAMVKLPPGKVRVLGDMCNIRTSALGAARTMDVGWLAHTDTDGDAVIADPNGLLAALDVSSATSTNLVIAPAATHLFDSQDGVTITIEINADVIDIGETFNGYIAYVVD